MVCIAGGEKTVFAQIQGQLLFLTISKTFVIILSLSGHLGQMLSHTTRRLTVTYKMNKDICVKQLGMKFKLCSENYVNIVIYLNIWISKHSIQIYIHVYC